jgi:hypothetical protein
MNISNLSGNFIIDMDEVLVNISPAQYKTIRLNWLWYSKFFKDLGPLTDKKVLMRPTFKLTDWLFKDEFLDNEEKVKKVIHKMIVKDFFSTDLYAYLKPTEFAKKTVMNKAFIEHVRVKKVYILTRYVNDEMLKSKKRFVKKYFNHSKIEMIAVPLHEKKSDYVKKLKIDWNLFVDDEIKNIADFAENLNIEGKEFLIPRLGYNEMPEILDILIRGKGAVYNYYEPKD